MSHPVEKPTYQEASIPRPDCCKMHDIIITFQMISVTSKLGKISN